MIDFAKLRSATEAMGIACDERAAILVLAEAEKQMTALAVARKPDDELAATYRRVAMTIHKVGSLSGIDRAEFVRSAASAVLAAVLLCHARGVFE